MFFVKKRHYDIIYFVKNNIVFFVCVLLFIMLVWFATSVAVCYNNSENTRPGAYDTQPRPQEKRQGDLHDLLRKPETEEPTAMGDYFFIHA